MQADLENIVEAHTIALLQHLAICIQLGTTLAQGETMILLRLHFRNAVLETQQALAARQAQEPTEKEQRLWPSSKS